MRDAAGPEGQPYHGFGRVGRLARPKSKEEQMRAQTKIKATLALLLTCATATLAADTVAMKKLKTKDWTIPGIEMKLKLIPAGSFTMGSPKDEKFRRADEGQHQVEISQAADSLTCLPRCADHLHWQIDDLGIRPELFYRCDAVGIDRDQTNPFVFSEPKICCKLGNRSSFTHSRGTHQCNGAAG